MILSGDQNRIPVRMIGDSAGSIPPQQINVVDHHIFRKGERGRAIKRTRTHLDGILEGDAGDGIPAPDGM